jgi:hypothetical protein
MAESTTAVQLPRQSIISSSQLGHNYLCMLQCQCIMSVKRPSDISLWSQHVAPLMRRKTYIYAVDLPSQSPVQHPSHSRLTVAIALPFYHHCRSPTAARSPSMVNTFAFLSSLLAGLSSAQTVRKYNNRDCRGALAVCSVRSDVGAEQGWPQASCCDRGAKRTGSLRITGVMGSVGEVSIVYRGNFQTQCSVQDSIFLGSPIGCFTTQSLGTGAWLSCAREYVSPVFN